MWLIRLHLEASESNDIAHPEYGKAKGAFACCLVDFPDLEGAILLAKHYAAEGGLWLVGPDSTQKKVERADFNENEEDVQLFEEAVKDGFSCAHFIYTESEEDRRGAETEASGFAEKPNH